VDGGVGAGLADPRLVKVRAGARGSGWAVGTCGVLTARHVIAPFLDKQADKCLAVPDPAPGSAMFECTVVWQDPGRDLALLAVDQAKAGAWTAAVGRGQGPAVAEPGTVGLPAEAVGYPDATLDDDFPHPELVLGQLKPAGGAVSGRMPFDVEGTVPDDSRLWQGMSGAAVRDRPHGRLLGVVVKVDADRQQQRLYVAPLPDPAADTGFSAALAAVGAQPVMEAANAPAVRRLLAQWDQRGRPRVVGEVTGLDVFGARKARTDIDTHGDPYYPYVARRLDRDLALALDRRASGADTRVLLLVGEAMSGKSRTGAHALRDHPVLSELPLLIPQQGADLREVVELAPAGGAVLWLDDLNTFAAGLSPGAARYWQSRPGLVVVATLRTDLLAGLEGNPDLRPAWSLIEDDDLVEQFPLPAEWSADDQQALAGADDLVRGKVADGIPLGEVLAGAEELRSRLAVADPFQKAFAWTVIDWSRTGLTARLAETLAEELWTTYLPRKHLAVFQNQARAKRREEFERAADWARAPIHGTAAMLVTRTDDGLRAEDYLVAQRTLAREAIALPVWESALARAQADEAPEVIAGLGYNAAISDVFDIARAAWEPLAAGQTDQAPQAAYNLGLLLDGQGDVAGARTAYQRAIDSGHPDEAPPAAYRLGVMLEKRGDVAGARTAYQQAIDTGHPGEAPPAAFQLGSLLAEQGDVAGARTAYQQVVDSGHPGYAPEAAFKLGVLLAGEGDVAGARTAYQRAVDSGDLDYAPMAAVNLGLLLAGQGDVAGARTAYQQAIDSGDSYRAPEAALCLGVLLAGQQDVAGARTAFQQAVDSGNPDHAPEAAFRLGAMLEGQGDVAGAKTAYQQAIDTGHPDHAPAAAINLGSLLAEQGDVAGARTAFQQAIDSGHPDYAHMALEVLAELCAAEGDLTSAKYLLSQASSSGCENAGNYLALLEDHECGPAFTPAIEVVRVTAEAGDTDSMNFLGLHALSHGSREEARAWWARSAAAGDAIAALLIARADRSE
jgi:tetratricopeptide (TPR) repeat protein